jgi:EAL domain-containing protein (putative c-di-GMP-specific phosphodiesterase class I)/GGDEF domain-containing protein
LGESLAGLAEVLACARGVLVPGASAALLIIDVVDTRKLQVRLGLSESAALLGALRSGLKNAVAARGEVIPLDGGRFSVLVRAIRNEGHAVLAGEKLARVAQELLESRGVAVGSRISVGVALYPSQADEPHELLRLAQLAAEAAQNRASRVVVFDDRCRTEILAPWALGNRYAQALDTGELSVYYQPKICMSTGRPIGVEALLRWFQNGAVVATPDLFIPLAESSGLIHATTWYCLSNSLRMSNDLNGVKVAINVTPTVLHHREFLDMIRTSVSTWRIDPQTLTLEITEGALIGNFEEATVRLNQLRDFGITIAIDDFGTGYSSLSYFKKIPADELKIDKSFVMGMVKDSSDQRLVQTILALAKHFNLRTVAEGVEDWATFDELEALGCDHAQGFLFSPALPKADLDRWLRDHPGDLREGRQG